MTAKDLVTVTMPGTEIRISNGESYTNKFKVLAIHNVRTAAECIEDYTDAIDLLNCEVVSVQSKEHRLNVVVKEV